MGPAGQFDARREWLSLRELRDHIPRGRGPPFVSQIVFDTLGSGLAGEKGMLDVTDIPFGKVSRQLDIAPKTADNHIQSLYSKIGVSTRAGAALYALERGLVQ